MINERARERLNSINKNSSRKAFTEHIWFEPDEKETKSVLEKRSGFLFRGLNLFFLEYMTHVFKLLLTFTSTLTLTCLWVIEICIWNFQIQPECDQCVLYLKNRDFFYFLQAHLTRYFHHQKSYLIFCTWLIISLNSNQRERYNFFCRKYFSGMKIIFLNYNNYNILNFLL